MARLLGEHELKVLACTSVIETTSTDTYDEQAVLDNVTAGNVQELLACALQFAIVGAGGRSWGDVKVNGVQKSCQVIMDENNVLYKNTIDANLNPSDVTPRRLVRLFRYQIQKYIQESGKSSYLWRKYTDKSSPEHLVFPGAEHLIDEDDFEHLEDAYEELDRRNGTKFSERIERVKLARF